VILKIKECLPDVILLDLNLPHKNGFEILKEVKRDFPEIKIIVLTMYNKESIIKEVIKFKGNAFLLKNCSKEDLICALDAVFDSESIYIGEGIGKISEEIIDDDFYKKINITRREKEIIFELVNGLSVPKISEKLFISAYTVETHKKNIFRKLNIHNSIDLVKFVNESKMSS
jgi:DNA-binding NarL/FixJ family response regulator